MTTTENAPGPEARAARASTSGGPRTYEVRTYGCQMNVHDFRLRRPLRVER